MMLGAQFSSLGVVGFMIYRGCKKNEAFRQARNNDGERRGVSAT